MKFFATIVCTVLLLSGCTTLMAPGNDLIDHTRVAKLGDSEPADKGEYILHIPAGENLPIRILLDGSMFKDEENIEANVRLNRDLYLYKYWASYDGKNWQKWGSLIDIEVSSGMGTKGAELNATINEANEK